VVSVCLHHLTTLLLTLLALHMSVTDRQTDRQTAYQITSNLLMQKGQLATNNANTKTVQQL